MPLNRQNKIDLGRKRCECGAFTSNMRKHKSRNRCARQHIRRVNGQKPKWN